MSTKTENGETITYTLGAGDRLASWTDGAYTYDAAGCVTRIERDGKPTLDLTWNGLYQLVSVSTNGVFAEGYAYDALGRRVSTTTAEGTTRHVYDDNWQVIADIDEQGNAIVSYTWGAGIDNLLAVKIGGATYYPLTDIQGTAWGYVDTQNNIVARWQYDAWGNVVDEDVSIPVLASLRYRFQGREWFAATGLINFRMRWYDAETGRWLSKDPIGLSGGLNLYVAFEDNPVCFCDPEGCFSWSQFKSFAKGFLIGASVAVGVAVIAPAVAAVGAATLVALGIAETTAATVATGTVTFGLFVAGVSGTIGVASCIIDDFKNHDYEDLAYTLGTITGGTVVGAVGGGRYISESLMGKPSPAPNTFDLMKLLKYEYDNRYDPSLGPPNVKYWATAPTPLSGGTAAIASSSGGIVLVEWICKDTESMTAEK